MSSVSISRGRTPASPLRGSRALAGRLKVAAVVASMSGFGAIWGLVSLNVVGVTNRPAQGSGGTVAPPANAPANNFFGQSQQQPQPNLFTSGFGAGSGNGPIFQSRTS